MKILGRFSLLAFLFLTCALGAQENPGSSLLPNAKPVYESVQETKPLKVGDPVPNGVLKTMSGNEIHLKTLVQEKPTIIIFYGGGWCPVCKPQLGSDLQDLKKMGYQVLAITPDLPHA